MQKLTLILGILAGCLLVLDIYLSLAETSFLEGEKKWLMVAYLSLILISDVILYFQRKKEKRLSNNDL
jgi:hypothetical protein